MLDDSSKNGNLREAAIFVAGSLVIAATITLIQNGGLGDLTSRTLRTIGVANETELPLASSTTAYPDQEARATALAEYKDVDPPSYLVYATTTNKIGGSTMYDLYIGDDKQNGLKLLHYKNRQLGATTTYPIHRIYPNTVSTAEIIDDFSSPTDAKIFPAWFGKEPVSYSSSPTTGLLSKNLITGIYTNKASLPEWLIVPAECVRYAGGDECSFTISVPNPYDLPASTLTQTTGSFKWSRLDSPYEIYVTNDKKILIRWGFGDAGAFSLTESLWDPTVNTLTRISTLGGHSHFYTGYNELTANVNGKLYTYAHPENTSGETDLILKQEPFSGWSIYGEPLKDRCHSPNFYPTDLTSSTAPWLVEYRYGCLGETVSNLSAWYELDPSTDSLRALTGVMPR